MSDYRQGDYERPDFFTGPVPDRLIAGFPLWDNSSDHNRTIESVAAYGRRMFAAGLREAAETARDLRKSGEPLLDPELLAEAFDEVAFAVEAPAIHHDEAEP